MNDSWTVEIHGRDGRSRLHHPNVTTEEALDFATLALKVDETGSVVIYRAIAVGRQQHKEGGVDHGRVERLGLVGDEPVAGGNRRPDYCKYCDTTDGHTAACAVIS